MSRKLARIIRQNEQKDIRELKIESSPLKVLMDDIRILEGFEKTANGQDVKQRQLVLDILKAFDKRLQVIEQSMAEIKI